ncbi:DoxX family membrane protein [Flavobacterium rhizosphaerae]|uniref:DoxX family membrane protein n=1 Tax=Flavobacterium rhizosphaerae TaxID=3163298 RepID=A0ABW8YVB9_9FLAO
MMKPLPYLLLRLLAGMSLFGHGLVRMPKLMEFSNWMTAQFAQSMLPQILVKPFSYILPFAELLTGFLLLIGLFTKQAVVAGAIIMMVLIFGSAMLEQWDAIPSQLIHGAILVCLLQYIASNHYSIDYKYNL